MYQIRDKPTVTGSNSSRIHPSEHAAARCVCVCVCGGVSLSVLSQTVLSLQAFFFAPNLAFLSSTAIATGARQIEEEVGRETALMESSTWW